MKFNLDEWNALKSRISSLLSSTTQIKLDIKNAQKLSLDTSRFTSQFSSNSTELKSSIDQLELLLTSAEQESHPDSRKFEQELLNLSKRVGRVLEEVGTDKRTSLLSRNAPPLHQVSSNNETSTESHLHLQTQLVQDQDIHLTELGNVISRQKQIGLAISRELDTQVEILDDVDSGVERVQRRLGGVQGRLDNFVNQDAGCRNTGIIVGLLGVLLVVIWAARHL